MRWSNRTVRVLVGVVALAACKANDNAPARSEGGLAYNQAGAPAVAARVAPQPAAVGDVSAARRRDDAAEEQPVMMTMADTIAAPEPSAPGVPSPAASTAMIIRTGNATIQVDS